MNATTLFLASLLMAASFTGSPAEACGDYHSYFRLMELSKAALSDDADTAAEAIDGLRAEGMAGLFALIGAHQQDVAADTPVAQLSGKSKRVRAAIDKVAGQKDAHASMLFWHTDFHQALAEAKKRTLPILSLRLLGRLDEDLSCANSRFFRTALYANQEIATKLRSRFVLHWESVRPVPVITIDFGDGRKICRTITGNSIHYVLDRNGEPVEAIPGLYGPKAFLKQLEDAEVLIGKLRATETAQARAAELRAWHVAKGQETDAAWTADLAKIGRPVATPHGAPGSTGAGDAALRAVGKRRVELPILKQLGLRPAVALRAGTDEAAWNQIAALHADEARLDDGSKTLFRVKGTDAQSAVRLAVSKMIVEDPMIRALRNFETSLAKDTVRNEYDFHRTIHRWFVDREVSDLRELNERVYAQLFRTPSSDPWLGLVPTATYAALDAGGLSAK